MRMCHSSWCFILLLVFLSPSFGEQAPAEKSARTAIQSFDNALFFSTRDHGGYGIPAIDLHWEADGYAADPLNNDFYQKLSNLYAGLQGDHLVRVTLSDSGWTVVDPKSRSILAQNQASGVLVIITNQTSRPQSLAVNVGGRNIAGQEKHLDLEAGETSAVVADISSDSLGVFHAQINVKGEHQATATLEGAVRTAVHLHMRVLDADGHVTPARVYIREANGFSQTPSDAFDRYMWITGEHYFYTPGSVEVVLPAGKTKIEVRKGFDYEPIVQELNLSSANSTLDVKFKWLRNMNADGWYSGDDHIHGNYVGQQWTTPADDFLIVRAEGLNMGNIMVANSVGSTIHDERFFEGHTNALSNGKEIIRWNQEMRTWSYGHLLFLNLKHLVRPLYTGFPDTEQWEDYPSNYSQAQQGREQGGVALYAHPGMKFNQIPTGSSADELAIDVALHGIDAIEVFCSLDEPSAEMWYRFLNLGFKLGLSGGSDAFLNQHFAPMPGGERVYVYTGHEFSDTAWTEGLRQGGSFATVGPLLNFEVDGERPGGEKHFAMGPAQVSVKVEAVSTIPFTKIEIVSNGQVVKQISAPKATQHLKWNGKLELKESSWLAARVWAPDNDRITDAPSRWAERRSPNITLAAHSSPFYIKIGDQPIYSASDRDYFLHWVDVIHDRILKEGKFASDAHRAEVLTTFDKARKVFEKLSPGASQ